MLSEEARVHIETIRKFERGTTDKLRRETEDALVNALLPHVEFNGTRGASLRDDTYRLLEGPDCYLQLLDEVYRALHNKADAEVLSICTDDTASPPAITQAIQRWHDAGIKCRFLTHEKARKFDFPLREYRAIPEHFYTNSVMIVFADRVAILRGTNDSVMVISDAEQADMLRGLFEMIWLASPTPKGPKS